LNQLSIKNTTPNVGTAWPEFLLRSKALIFFEILFRILVPVLGLPAETITQ
jgi:hypothetical protein